MARFLEVLRAADRMSVWWNAGLGPRCCRSLVGIERLNQVKFIDSVYGGSTVATIEHFNDLILGNTDYHRSYVQRILKENIFKGVKAF